MNRLITILGPTAVGKTALSFTLAKHYGADIISGDAYQVYRYMNIGTAKPSAEELSRYRHYLIDVADPDETYTAARFCQMAGAAVCDINQRGRLPVLVGGTGLYVQSFLEGYHFDVPQANDILRQQAKNRIEGSSAEELRQYIVAQTGWEAPDWHELFCNTHRLTRLIEAIEAGQGQTCIKGTKEQKLVYDSLVIGLVLPRDILYDRINKRVDSMLNNGWEEEVRHLLERGLTTEYQAMKAIGYREIAAYLSGQMSRMAAVEQIKRRTRQFAKRQITWYKRMPYIQWFSKDRYASEEALAREVIMAIDHKWNLEKF